MRRIPGENGPDQSPAQITRPTRKELHWPKR
jgi:hypothetical protein